MVLCCFHRIRGQTKWFGVGLGACPWRTWTDATELHINLSLWPLETHLPQPLLWTLLWHKDEAENVSKHDLWTSPVFFSKAYCGQKKRGSWAQKGKRSHWILLHCLNLWWFYTLMWWVNAKCDVFLFRQWNLWWKRKGALVSTIAWTFWKTSSFHSQAEM